FLAIAFWVQSIRSQSWRGLLSGASIAIALLSSVEIGLCSLITIPATGIAGMILLPEERKKYFRSTLMVAAGVAIMMLPLVIRFWVGGDLGEVVKSVLVYPKYAMLGYAAIPYPNLAAFLRQDLAADRWWLPVVRKVFLMWYLPVAIYSLS